jgi:hypothetical protein
MECEDNVLKKKVRNQKIKFYVFWLICENFKKLISKSRIVLARALVSGIEVKDTGMLRERLVFQATISTLLSCVCDAVSWPRELM